MTMKGFGFRPQRQIGIVSHASQFSSVDASPTGAVVSRGRLCPFASPKQAFPIRQAGSIQPPRMLEGPLRFLP
jgi:hypothetical protein